MAVCNDTVVYGIEMKYGVQAIESEGRGLWYLQDDDRKMMGIMTIIDGNPSWVILKKSQIKTLINELQDVYDTMFDVEMG